MNYFRMMVHLKTDLKSKDKAVVIAAELGYTSTLITTDVTPCNSPNFQTPSSSSTENSLGSSTFRQRSLSASSGEILDYDDGSDTPTVVQDYALPTTIDLMRTRTNVATEAGYKYFKSSALLNASSEEQPSTSRGVKRDHVSSTQLL